jgi:ubiquinone/menaquinone biosynthesis C-methylase UbiE
MIEEFIVPGTKFTLTDGIYQILDPEFAKKLKTFAAVSIESKSPDNLDRIEDYEQLPFISSSKHKMDWKLRQEDVRNIERQIGRKPGLSILEVGPFNSWLSHRLQKGGHKLVCVDYFDDAAYGLKSKFFYRNHDWISIQCNMEELGFLQSCFDVIILNHGLQFFSSTEHPLVQLKKLLKPGGKLIILGIFIFRDDTLKRQQVAAYKKEFCEKTGMQKFMHPTVKGLLNKDDLAIFKKQQISLFPYRFCVVRNAVARIFKRRQSYQYGVYAKP